MSAVRGENGLFEVSMEIPAIAAQMRGSFTDPLTLACDAEESDEAYERYYGCVAFNWDDPFLVKE
jgi:hypothetical protein